MKRLIVIIILIISFSKISFAQTDSVYTGAKPANTKKSEKKKEDDWRKNVTYGGNFQLLFGSVTYIYLTPTIGYIPFKRANVGVGFVYNYTSANYSGYGRFSQTIYGGHSYARLFFSPNFFGQVQYDKLFQPDWVYDPKKRVWVDYAMVGVGYSQPVGNLAAFNTTIMYNLTPQVLSIYPSRFIFQVGFNARLK